jgi:putative nucleotidyltransferase with HDIG domain
VNPSVAAAITALAGTRRAVQLYPPAHPAYGEAVKDLEVAIRGAAKTAPFVLNFHQGLLYDGSLPIPDDIPGLAQVAEMFESLAIESLVFQSSFSATEAVGLTEVLSLHASPDLDLGTEFAKRGITSVAASLLARAGEEEGEVDLGREQDRALFRRSVSAARGVLEQISMGNPQVLAEARAVVENLIPRMVEDSAAVLSMAAARRPEEGELFHSISTMIYALLLGHRLGLPSEGLASLGSAAMLHDIGKSAFNLNDPEQTERARVEHPRAGAEMLQHLALDDVAPMLVAYEHHMYVNGSGWPERAQGYVTHPYSRIVSIADRFVNLTTPAPGTDAMTPDRALVQVLREANQLFDPFFSRLFANMLGPFPVGCVVRLSDQSVGIVYRPGVKPLSPVVRLAYDSNGLEVTHDRDVDLSQTDISIVEIVAPGSLDVDVAELL